MIRRRDRASSSPKALFREDAAALDTAWRIHQAQGEWTSRVDAKAAFAFTIESGAIAITIALTAEKDLIDGTVSWWLLSLYLLGLGLLLTAAGFAALVVTPQLRKGKVNIESRQNFIYFGHARLWEPDKLEKALREDFILPQLSQQIVIMARIAWLKNIRVQWSFRLTLVGVVCLVICGIVQAF